MRKKIIIILIILLVFVASIHWLNGTGIIANSDGLHGYNSQYFLSKDYFSWKDTRNGGGYVPIPIAPQLVMGAFANYFGVALSSAGITFLLMISLWVSLYYLIVLILNVKDFLSKFIVAIISSYIISNEIIKNYLISNNTVLWAELFTILAIFFYFKYYYETKNKYLIFSLVSLSFTLIMFHSLILASVFLFLYGLGKLYLSRKSDNKNRVNYFRKFIVFMLLLLGFNSYFLFGNLSDIFVGKSSVLSSYSANKGLTDQVLQFVNEHYNNLGFNFILSRDAFYSKYPPLFKSVIIYDYYLILLISLAALFFLRNKAQDQSVRKRMTIFFFMYIVI